MPCEQRSFVLVCLLLLLLHAIDANAQGPSRLVSGPIDDSKRITLSGNVHPLAQPQYDLGRVSDGLAVNRVLLLLNRPAEREKALQQFLQDVHTRSSSVFHHWLTPEQIGRQFGSADSDVQAAEGWLRSHGFVVARTSKSKQYVEFSGTAGSVRSAFGTEIHQYNVKGELHYANASEISIPAALAPLVRGVSPLNNFRAQSYVRPAGRALYSHGSRKATAQWTIANPFGTSNPYAFLVSPEDFATQYDLAPLYQAGVNGSGQTLGIINESNIDLSLVSAYQQLFGVSGNVPQVVIDGDDPGDNGADVEAYLDVELSGAVAPGATVNLYISNGSDFQDPISLAALRAVEDNQASVLSVSFGQCEQSLGNVGNQFWSTLWEQAAAQGQTVLVAAGDTGPECDLAIGISVSGLASTPWNVAMGGTDFYYSDYASGGASATTLWNQTNDSNLGSLKAPLPEQVWNDPFGLDIISDGIQRGEIYSGGGGQSSCASQGVNANGPPCISGYPKPVWQTGPGTQTDSVRDLPDLSLFASNGANLSAYPICAFEGDCAAGTQGNAEVVLAGGTSASAPAMAAIMALINQKYGRQGQANFVLYPLSQQKPSAFHDVTLGSNDSVCLFSGIADCVTNANGDLVTTIYSAETGFDLASGLGSVDANALVNDWNSITFTPTTTTLSLSTAKITHGTPVTVTTSVAPSSGSGTPSGGVAILTSSSLPAAQSQTVLTLTQGTASQSINSFPGGYYNVTAAYHGDAVYGDSTSSSVALTVTPENSNINFSVLNGQNQQVITGGGSIQYDVPLALAIQPVGVSAASGKTDGAATGTAAFTLDSTSATVALNSAGVAGWTAPALAIGSHTANATYSGDASFNASSASLVTFSVTKGYPFMTDSIITPSYGPTEGPSYNVPVGGSLTLGIEVGPFNGPLLDGIAPFGTLGPTGTVTFCLGITEQVCQNPSYSQTVPLAPPTGNYSQYSSAIATFTNIQPGPYGQYVPTYQYNGDANWQSSGLLDLAFINIGSFPTLTPTTTTLGITPASISGAQLANFNITVTGATSASAAPTGWVYCYTGGVTTVSDILTQGTGANSSVSFYINSSWFWSSGTNQLTCYYEGDTNYMPSASNAASLSVTQYSADFALAPQQPQITVQSGGSANVALNLTSFGNFNGVVTLACTPSSSQITCAVNPSAPTLNGAATATLTVNSAAQTANLLVPPNAERRLRAFAVDTSFLVFGLVFVFGVGKRGRRVLPPLSLVVIAALLIAPGCGGGAGTQTQQQQSPPPNSSYYSVLVTGTANGIVHNAKVIVAVQ